MLVGYQSGKIETFGDWLNWNENDYYNLDHFEKYVFSNIDIGRLVVM